MQHFTHDGFDIAFIDVPAAQGGGEPILLIHGFASNHYVNWVAPGWVQTLTQAGYRTIALDNRAHGASTKSYEAADYTQAKLAADAGALLDHLGLAKAHVMGYSMGARISATLALAQPQNVASLILGGLGYGMVSGFESWNPVADALLADDPATVTHERGRMFRLFAEQTKSDRRALATCFKATREVMSEEDARRISPPTLVAVGTTDDIAGSPQKLAALLPHAEAFDIERRDHMLAVGDRTFKRRALEFLKSHAIS